MSCFVPHRSGGQTPREACSHGGPSGCAWRIRSLAHSPALPGALNSHVGPPGVWKERSESIDLRLAVSIRGAPDVPGSSSPYDWPAVAHVVGSVLRCSRSSERPCHAARRCSGTAHTAARPDRAGTWRPRDVPPQRRSWSTGRADKGADDAPAEPSRVADGRSPESSRVEGAVKTRTRRSASPGVKNGHRPSIVSGATPAPIRACGPRKVARASRRARTARRRIPRPGTNTPTSVRSRSLLSQPLISCQAVVHSP
jgi:hypothetical protein